MGTQCVWLHSSGSKSITNGKLEVMVLNPVSSLKFFQVFAIAY